MDCNGCVQKIKKALHGINGIYDLYIDFPQQKLTIIGWADPEKIVKAIRKTRKIATICSHTEQTETAAQAPPTEQVPESSQPKPAPEAANPSPAEPPATEAAPPAESAPPAEPPKDPPSPKKPLPESAAAVPAPVATEANTAGPSQPTNPHAPKDVGEVHVIYHHPPDYNLRYGFHEPNPGHWNRCSTGQGYLREQSSQPPQPIYVTHSYNTYKPSPYVTEYEHVPAPARHTHYSRIDHYSEDYHNNNNNNGNGNITAMFSDENPNACTIM